MPGKMTKSILRPPFRPPRYRQPSAARVYLAGRSEKRKIFTSAPELILGNPWLMSFRLGLFSAGLRRTELRELLAGSLFPNRSYALEY